MATIVGTSGPDRLIGTPGDDVIAALGGGDWVDGRGGDDVLCGGEGHDQLMGRGGDDRLLGGLDGPGEDNSCGVPDVPYVPGDHLMPGPGDDYVDGGYDPRQASRCGRPDLVTFTGSPSGIRAVLGDPGQPGVVRVGADRDVVVGERTLEVRGTRYDDRIRGSGGDEVLQGIRGRDVIVGGAGDDVLYDGRYGGDARTVDPSGDRLLGGEGTDELHSSGRDELRGGRDDDFLAHDYSCSTVAGGAGSDELSLEWPVPNRTLAVAFDAAAGTVSALPTQPACGRFTEFESYTMLTIGLPESFTGTDGPDVLRGSGLAGLTASMRGGADVVTGTEVDDVIDGGDGPDEVDAGLGRDVCISAETAKSCEADVLPPPPPSCDGLVATMVIRGSDSLIVGTPGDDVIYGSEGRDQINGLGGNDVICGRAGDDIIRGEEGDDRIFAGEDQVDPNGTGTGDFVLPGPGDDYVDLGFGPPQPGLEGFEDVLDYSDSATGITAHLAPAGGTFTVTGEGTDTVTTHAAYEVKGSGYADNLTGSSGDDRVFGMGGDDQLDGGAGDDLLDGDGGCSSAGCNPVSDQDVLVGGDGRDSLVSEIGRDDIDGGPGNDFLLATSEMGVGTMAGGTGADTLRVFVSGPESRGRLDGGPDIDRLRVVADETVQPGTLLVVDAALGRVRARGLGQLFLFSGAETYYLDVRRFDAGLRPVIFRFLGTVADEALTVRPLSQSVLRAKLRGGDDLVNGSRQDDVIDGGAGTDTVNALPGDDRCVHVEVAHGCEVLSP